MKIKIDSQLKTLAALKDRVRDQVVDMQRLEVRLCLKFWIHFQGDLVRTGSLFYLNIQERMKWMFQTNCSN